MRPTLKTIADSLGFSVTTVSRVLNRQSSKYRISKQTEAHVVKTAKELGFIHNSLTRGLRTKRTFTLGLIMPDISNPFFATFARNVEQAARK